MRSHKTLTIVLFIFCFAAISFGQERYVTFIDEAKNDPSFLAFRTRLIAAVEKKDTKYLFSIVDKNIKNDFGGNDGFENFKTQWNFDDPGTTFWRTFLPVLQNGGAFGKEGVRDPSFYAPFVAQVFPADLDAFEYHVITGKNVNLRKAGDPNAPVVASLSYNVVKVDEENSIEGRGPDGVVEWYAVETLGGKKGFVNARYVYSPIGFRAAFTRIKGRWKLTSFLAGD